MVTAAQPAQKASAWPESEKSDGRGKFLLLIERILFGRRPDRVHQAKHTPHKLWSFRKKEYRSKGGDFKQEVALQQTTS